MEFSDHNPEDMSGGHGEVPPADAFSFSGESLPAGQPADQDAEPEIVAHPDLEREASPDVASEAVDAESQVQPIETVRDMPYAEQGALADKLEEFVRGGRPYTFTTTEYTEDGEPYVVTSVGMRRRVSPGALAAEGLAYDEVEVATIDDGDEPPAISLAAKRTRDYELSEESETGSEPIVARGEEIQGVCLTREEVIPGAEPMVLMEAEGIVTIPPPEETSPNEDSDPPTQLKSLTEPFSLEDVRAIVRAIDRADEFPDELEPTDKAVDEQVLSAETVLDMPDDEQERFMSAMEHFAAGGERFSHPFTPTGEPDHDPHVPFEGYSRTIPVEALREEGLDYAEVVITVVEPNPEERYSVNLVTYKSVGYQISLPPDLDGKTAFRMVKGEEVKKVGFLVDAVVPGTEPIATMDVDSYTLAVDAEGPFLDPSTPLLTLAEVRALIRAMDRIESQAA